MAAIPENHGVLSEHRAAFFTAAKRGNVAIAVRCTKWMSLRHVGKAFATSKRVDCKAKTADFDFATPAGLMVPGGLVANPQMAGPSAYRAEKWKGALASWEDFQPMLAPEMAGETATADFAYVPGGRQYFVETRPGDRYWGCVKFTSSGLIAAGKPIHGDYDLYDIVPMEDPTANFRALGAMAGQKHAKGKYFVDVQTWVNSAIGYPMILHGSQAKYLPTHDADDGIVVFFPDGRLEAYDDSAAVRALYQDAFGGRKLFQDKIRNKDFVPYHTT